MNCILTLTKTQFLMQIGHIMAITQSNELKLHHFRLHLTFENCLMWCVWRKAYAKVWKMYCFSVSTSTQVFWQYCNTQPDYYTTLHSHHLLLFQSSISFAVLFAVLFNWLTVTCYSAGLSYAFTAHYLTLLFSSILSYCLRPRLSGYIMLKP